QPPEQQTGAYHLEAEQQDDDYREEADWVTNLEHVTIKDLLRLVQLGFQPVLLLAELVGFLVVSLRVVDLLLSPSHLFLIPLPVRRGRVYAGAVPGCQRHQDDDSEPKPDLLDDLSGLVHLEAPR